MHLSDLSNLIDLICLICLIYRYLYLSDVLLSFHLVYVLYLVWSYSIIFYFFLSDLTLSLLPYHVFSDPILPCLSELSIFISLDYLSINNSVVYTTLASFRYHRWLLVRSIVATCCDICPSSFGMMDTNWLQCNFICFSTGECIDEDVVPHHLFIYLFVQIPICVHYITIVVVLAWLNIFVPHMGPFTHWIQNITMYSTSIQIRLYIYTYILFIFTCKNHEPPLVKI